MRDFFTELVKLLKYHISTKLLAYMLIYNKSTLQLVQVIFDFHYVSKYLIISLKMMYMYIGERGGLSDSRKYRTGRYLEKVRKLVKFTLQDS